MQGRGSSTKIPRDYLSDTPLLRAMGFWVSQHGQSGAIPPPPFLSISPLGSMRSGGAIPPPPQRRGISAILARYPMKTRQVGAIPPSAILSRKGIARYGGGISHRAAKVWLSNISLARGNHPHSRKYAPRVKGQMNIFHAGSHQFRESLRELLRESWFSQKNPRAHKNKTGTPHPPQNPP